MPIAQLVSSVLFLALCLLFLAAIITLTKWWFCWLFRINDIVNLLSEISDKLSSKSSDCDISPKQSRCDFCNQLFPGPEMTELASGEFACPVCLPAGSKTKLKPSKDNNL